MTALFLLFLFALFLVLYPFYVVSKQISGYREPIEKTPAQWGASFENIDFVTDDGLVLKGWWIPGKGRKAVMLLHGKSGSRNGYHSGIFDLGQWYHSRGYHVMMADMRAHGESGGKYVYFGVRESCDMLGWLRKIDPLGEYRWVLHGFSLGAVTAMMMLEREPALFGKVVADAPWIDFEMLVKSELKKRAHLPPFTYPYVAWIAQNFFGQDFRAADNRGRCRRLCGRPILYIREEEDALLPPWHWRLLERACPQAKVALFEGVGHVEAFTECPRRYTKLLEAEGL
ncbi:alpha/beta hydrolase [Hydrogenimonas urashimensis]|uniref:alpha/beta hydrolase n=1 Tax=Hydrogenimonas urashimensis TaxID=2740515 RepID=UPI0019151A46|nr:alpha/beta hydrolase [Hydrogenimonas urashimensis]